MTKSTRSRAAFAALLAAAAMASGAPAQAAHGGNQYDQCEGGAERLEAEFREIEAKHGWDKAAKWWDKAWERYYESCVVN